MTTTKNPVRFTSALGVDGYDVIRREDDVKIGQVVKRVEHYNIAPRPITATSWIAYDANGQVVKSPSLIYGGTQRFETIKFSTRAAAVEHLLSLKPVAPAVVENEDDGICPVCGGTVDDDRLGFTCSDECAERFAEPDFGKAPTQRQPTDEDIAAAVEQAKKEILDDIESGVVPLNVPDFVSLDNHVDRNTYGGFCDDDSEIDWGFSGDVATDGVYRAQAILDEWLISTLADRETKEERLIDAAIVVAQIEIEKLIAAGHAISEINDLYEVKPYVEVETLLAGNDVVNVPQTDENTNIILAAIDAWLLEGRPEFMPKVVERVVEEWVRLAFSNRRDDIEVFIDDVNDDPMSVGAELVDVAHDVLLLPISYDWETPDVLRDRLYEAGTAWATGLTRERFLDAVTKVF